MFKVDEENQRQRYGLTFLYYCARGSRDVDGTGYDRGRNR